MAHWQGPLADIRVLDLTAGIVGPLVTRFLADFGAEVIKIEVPAGQGEPPRGIDSGGDLGDWHVVQDPAWDRDPTFNNLNRGKLSCALNLQNARGRELFLTLVKHSDVVVTNFSSRVLPGLQLDLPYLAEVKSNVILAQVTGYGADGPKRDWVAFGPTVESSVGMALRNSYPGIGPSVTTQPHLDLASAVRAVSMISFALSRRHETGAQVLDISMQETGMLLQAVEAVAAKAGSGDLDVRPVNSHPHYVPYGVFRTIDNQWLAVSIESDACWKSFRSVVATVAGVTVRDCGAEESWSDLARRQADQHAVNVWASLMIARCDGIALETALLVAGVDASLVRSPRDVLHDRSLVESRFFAVADNGMTGPKSYPTSPVRWGGRRLATSRPPPRFSQDTESVLARLCAVETDKLQILVHEGVISTPGKANG